MLADLRLLVRFFLVVPVVSRAMLGGFVLVTGAGAVLLVADPSAGARAAMPVLLLQLFAAASGFRVPARRGHYDLLLTGGASRVTIGLVHWAMSAAPGVGSYAVLAVVEYMVSGGDLTTAGSLATVYLVSALPWALTVPFSRLTGGIVLLVLLALLAALVPDGGAPLAPSLLSPGASRASSGAAMAAGAAAFATVVLAAALAGIARISVALESSQ